MKDMGLIQFDYTFWSGAGIPGAPSERRALTSLTAVHEATGYCMATVVERKGAWPYAVANIVKFIKDLNLDPTVPIVMRGDAEPALMALLDEVKSKVPNSTMQQAPFGSHQSIGTVEQKRDTVGAQVRVLVSAVQRKAGVLVKPLRTFSHG